MVMVAVALDRQGPCCQLQTLGSCHTNTTAILMTGPVVLPNQEGYGRTASKLDP